MEKERGGKGKLNGDKNQKRVSHTSPGRRISRRRWSGVSHLRARGPRWKKRSLNMANGSLMDVQTQNKLGRRAGHKGALGKSDWMSCFFLIKSEIESSSGSKIFPWQTLGRTGGSRMGTGKIEKLYRLPLCLIPLQIQFL